MMINGIESIDLDTSVEMFLSSQVQSSLLFIGNGKKERNAMQWNGME